MVSAFTPTKTARRGIGYVGGPTDYGRYQEMMHQVNLGLVDHVDKEVSGDRLPVGIKCSGARAVWLVGRWSRWTSSPRIGSERKRADRESGRGKNRSETTVLKSSAATDHHQGPRGGPEAVRVPNHLLYRKDRSLILWNPRGILDEATVTEIVAFIETVERCNSQPLDRFADLSGLDADGS